MFRQLKGMVGIMLAIVLICVFLYGVYWVSKTFSYAYFYEDMVKRTIVQMVKPDALKEAP